MLKFAGSILILVGCIGYGNYLCSCLTGHIRDLMTAKELFLRLLKNRQYTHLPFPELLIRTSENDSNGIAESFLHVAEKMQSYQVDDVGEIWRDELCSIQDSYLTEQDIELFAMLFGSLVQGGNVEELVQLYLTDIDERIVQAKTQKYEKQRIYRAVSLMAGLFLIILLL